ncbi:xylulokinase [Paenibacillus eucommiae]|uniref:Xylulokinase n=2 Tax=Paenibacillus eucommiae TaxID=1355755 RepID=A0ABS4J349_9BACL|nr:xylulokinase [Paenibacillus eucommiae]
MHGMVLIDHNHEVIRPAIIWSDQRTVSEVEEVYRLLGKDRLGEITLNPISTGFQTASLLWIKNNERGYYERIFKVLSPKDYIRMQLTGTIGTEITDASATLAFDTTNRQWSELLLSRVGLDSAMYPEVSNPFDIAGEITSEASQETGLAPGTPVAFGGGDQSMQAVGNGIVQPGQVSLTIGTGGQVFSVIEKPYYDPQLRTHTFCNAIPGTWNIMGASLSAGLVFLPYLSGERTPHMDPSARGTFLGLALKHDKAHLLRSVMEGVVFALKDSAAIFQELGIHMDMFIASGGGARSQVWMQIQADIMNREIYKSDQSEQACLGAAIMAGVGVKRYTSVFEACSVLIKFNDQPVTPIAENVRIYEEVYGIYRDAYQQNKELFQRLSRIP